MSELLSKKEDGNKSSDGEGEFIQVRKKSEKTQNVLNPDKNDKVDKKKSKSRSRNNSLGEGKSSKPR